MNGSYDLPTNGVLTGVRTTTDPITFWSQHFPGSQNIHLQHPPEKLGTRKKTTCRHATGGWLPINQPSKRRIRPPNWRQCLPQLMGEGCFVQKKNLSFGSWFLERGKNPSNKNTKNTRFFLKRFCLLGLWFGVPKNPWGNSPHPKKRCFRSHPQPGRVRSSNLSRPTINHREVNVSSGRFWIGYFVLLCFGLFPKKSPNTLWFPAIYCWELSGSLSYLIGFLSSNGVCFSYISKK